MRFSTPKTKVAIYEYSISSIFKTSFAAPFLFSMEYHHWIMSRCLWLWSSTRHRYQQTQPDLKNLYLFSQKKKKYLFIHSHMHNICVKMKTKIQFCILQIIIRNLFLFSTKKKKITTTTVPLCAYLNQTVISSFYNWFRFQPFPATKQILNYWWILEEIVQKIIWKVTKSKHEP